MNDVRMIAEIFDIMTLKGYECYERTLPFYQVEFIKDGWYYVLVNPLHFKSVNELIEHVDYQIALLKYQENHS